MAFRKPLLALVLFLKAPWTQAHPPVNLTTVSCSLPLEGPDINLYKEWSAFNLSGQDGYCYDNHGTGYGMNQTFIACESCMVFVCTSTPCEGRDGSLFKLWWMLSSIADQCCLDRLNRVIPPNKGSHIQLHDKCQSVEKLVCITTASSHGSLEVSYQSSLCCLDGSGWQPEGSSHLEPATCSQRTCEASRPAFWNRTVVFQGDGCCILDGKMYEDGSVEKWQGDTIKCCNGEWLTANTTTGEDLSYCHIEDLTYLIDTSGSMGQSRPIWLPVALGVLAELKNDQVPVQGYTLMNYLTTVSVELQTTMLEDFVTAINTSTTTGGSRELTFAGLKAALQIAPRNNFIAVISDEVGDDTTNATLKNEIINLRQSTGSQIFFLMVARNNLQDMEDNFRDIGVVIDIANTTLANITDQVIETMKNSVICTNTTTPAFSTTNNQQPSTYPTKYPTKYPSTYPATTRATPRTTRSTSWHTRSTSWPTTTHMQVPV